MPSKNEKLDIRSISSTAKDEIYDKCKVLANAAGMSVSAYLQFLITKQYELKYGDTLIAFMHKEYITAREIATDLKISLSSAKRMVRKKILPGVIQKAKDGRWGYGVPRDIYLKWKQQRYIREEEQVGTVPLPNYFNIVKGIMFNDPKEIND